MDGITLITLQIIILLILAAYIMILKKKIKRIENAMEKLKEMENKREV